MPSLLARLRTLENKYNGPIPRAEYDHVLHDTPVALRVARTHIRFCRRRTNQAINASTSWRDAVTFGNVPPLSPTDRLARRVAFAHTIVLSTSRFLEWQTLLYGLTQPLKRL